MEFDYRIDGMHCAACVSRVTAALRPLASSVQVTLDPPCAHLTVDRPLSLETLSTAVASAGRYTIAPVGDAAVVAVAAGLADAKSAAASPSGTSPAESIPVAANSAVPGQSAAKSWLATYYPLLLIGGYIAVTALAGTAHGGARIDWAAWMTNVMAGFFLVFSAFKLLDLNGFADAYARYDLGAQRWRTWGFIYPFLELALGLAYLFRVAPMATNIATIALMGFSSLGVIRALARKQQIRCACLGTVLNVPMSTITLVEDLAMVAMATMRLTMGGG